MKIAQNPRLSSLAFGAVLLSTLLAVEGKEPLPPPLALRLNSPLDYQVFQRETGQQGTLLLNGSLAPAIERPLQLEARLGDAGSPSEWRTLMTLKPGDSEFKTPLKAPAGGWYRLEVRVRDGNTIAAESAVNHVGVGEVFIIAGQSNAANHGEERQSTHTGLVAAYHDGAWRLANDPQPGASGGGGSFMPPFGDAIATKFKVPVGMIAAGVGATSVREWLPRGVRFPNPPTLTGNVVHFPNNEWESKGALFDHLVALLRQAGPRGVRAVLWHQGESDANQSDPSRTLPGRLYRTFLEQIILDSRREAGWDCPWFVALASYHTPADPGSPDIRAAQRALWGSGVALEGPDTDVLTGDLRENGGKGVHFSGKGLREHGALWAEKVAQWLETQLRSGNPVHRERQLHRDPAPRSGTQPSASRVLAKGSEKKGRQTAAIR